MGNAEIQMQRMERILEISRELTSTVALEPLLCQIVDAATELTDTETAGILLERDGELHFVTAALFKEQLADIPVPIESSIAGAAFSSGEAVIVPDVRVDPRYYPIVEQSIGFEARSLLAVPLQFKDRHLGVLEVENKCDDGEFNQQDVETLTVLAAQAAVAIENARLVEELQRHRDRLEELVQERTARLELQREIEQSILAAQSPEAIAVAAVRRIRRLIPCQCAAILVIEQAGHTKMLATESSEDTGPLADANIYRELSESEILRQGGVQGVADLGALSRHTSPQRTLFAAGVRSYVIIPLFIQGELLGTLNLVCDQPRAFAPEQIAVATEVAASLAVAIRQAQLYEQSQQEIAEREQVEKALRRSQGQLSAILNSTQQAFVLFDRDYRIRAFNAPAQEHALALLGTKLQKGAFVRKHALYDLAGFMTNFGRALDGETITVENKLKDRDGNDYWVALTFNPVLAESARATGVCLNVSNITTRKQAE